MKRSKKVTISCERTNTWTNVLCDKKVRLAQLRIFRRWASQVTWARWMVRCRTLAAGGGYRSLKTVYHLDKVRRSLARSDLEISCYERLECCRASTKSTRKTLVSGNSLLLLKRWRILSSVTNSPIFVKEWMKERLFADWYFLKSNWKSDAVFDDEITTRKESWLWENISESFPATIEW